MVHISISQAQIHHLSTQLPTSPTALSAPLPLSASRHLTARCPPPPGLSFCVLLISSLLSGPLPHPATVPGPCEPEDLIDGIIFAANYLGSTQLLSERNPSKNIRMMQAQEAVSRVKVRNKKNMISLYCLERFCL